MLAMVLAGILAASTPGDAGTTSDIRYGWCLASEPTYGRYHLVSTVFQVEAGTYHVGVQNSFLSFAQAYDGRSFGFVSCGVTFGNWQEAEDSKNEFLAQRREAGHGVSLANWAYHGN